jgi:hypothetical protein
MDQTLSEEHQKLLAIAQRERLDSETVDLPNIRHQHQALLVEQLPTRVYGSVTKAVLKANQVGLSEDGGRWQLHKLPRSLRDLLTPMVNQSFTWGESDDESNQVGVVDRDSPLYLVAAELANQASSIEEIALELSYPTAAPLEVMGYWISAGDGNGQDLVQTVVHLARRTNGEWIQLSPYWLFGAPLKNIKGIGQPTDVNAFQRQAMQIAVAEMTRIHQQREGVVEQKVQYVRRSFDAQYQRLVNRLGQYQQTNVENRNSALINQTTAQLAALEDRRKFRLSGLERERAIQMRPVKPLYYLKLQPDENSPRIIPATLEGVMREWTLLSGYQNLVTLPAFG